MPLKVLNATLKFKRETKGTYLYEEVDANGQPTKMVLGTQYLQKSVFAGEQRPETINLTLSW